MSPVEIPRVWLLGFFGGLGMSEMMIIGIIAVILFGKKLPEVARQLGGSYREFRKGLSEMQSHVNWSETYSSGSYASRSSSSSSRSPSYDYDDYDEATAPKFEAPASEPTLQQEDQPSERTENA